MMQNNQKIPEGWSVKKLGETCFFFNGKAHENCVDENGKYVLINSKFISSNGQVCKRVNACLFPLIENDITIVMSDVPSGKAIAKCFLVNEADKYTLNQRIGCLRTKQAIPQYLVNIISRNKYFLKFDDGINQTNLRKDQILNCPLLLPPLPEQEKIAGILGTWDEAIEKLSNLIEQKKLLKKGLMQKLLTGKTRLPGFTQPWKEVAIQDFCNIKRGGSPRPIENYLTSSDDGLNWLKIGDISPDAKYIYKTESKIKKDGVSKTTLVHSDDFILSNSMSFGRPYIMKIDACIHDGWLALTSIKKDVSKEFLFYLLSFSETQKKFNICAAGSGVRNLNKDIVGEVKIQLPPYYEQQAIADVLSTADDEINLLNQKLEALKEQKKGLMQQLLTGQIRVKVN